MANDTDMVCPQCGTPLEAPQKDATDSIFRKIGIVFGAVILVAVLVNIIGANTGYQATVRKMVKYFQNEQTSKLVAMSTDFEKDFYEVFGDDYDDYCEQQIENKRDSIEDEVGKIKKITYKINYAEKMDSDDLDEAEEALDELDIKCNIKAIYTVSLTLTVKGSKDTKDYYTTIYVVKENGKWKLSTDSL
jgi:hypothetical protein